MVIRRLLVEVVLRSVGTPHTVTLRADRRVFGDIVGSFL